MDLKYGERTISEEEHSHFMDEEGIMDQWELMKTPFPVLTILALYLLFVLKLGPNFMEGREPYSLKNVMRVYNIVQVIYNLCFVFVIIYPAEGFIPIVLVLKSSCRIPNKVDGEEILKQTYRICAWYYLVLKIVDLFDTVFMVLRKKNSHITFLHLYHHVGMVIFTWITFKYIKAVQSVPIGFINMVVHALMYTYYFLSTFESFKNYLWLKKHLTKLQLAQFLIIIVFMGILYYRKCDISRYFTYMWEFNIVVILCLFLNFYSKNYISKSTTSPDKVKILKMS